MTRAGACKAAAPHSSPRSHSISCSEGRENYGILDAVAQVSSWWLNGIKTVHQIKSCSCVGSSQLPACLSSPRVARVVLI